MALYVGPSQQFEAVAQGFTTGLTGTIGVRIDDGAGANTTARSTASITEYPSGSGIYMKTLTAPANEGTYNVVWDDGSVYAVEQMVVDAAFLALPAS